MRSKLTRRLAGTAAVAALSGLAVSVTEANGPLTETTYAKAVEADTAHLTKLAGTVKTKKTALGRMKVTAALLAAYAQDSGDPKLAGVHAAALKVAAAAGKKDADGAAAAAKELADAKGGGTVKPVDLVTEAKLDISDIMNIMGGATGGGLNTEKDIKDWMKKGVTDATALKSAEVQAARSAVLADFTAVAPPEFGGKKKKEDWDKWSADMKKLSVDAAAEASKGDKADKAKLKKLFSGIDAACTNCHNVFKDD